MCYERMRKKKRQGNLSFYLGNLMNRYKTVFLLYNKALWRWMWLKSSQLCTAWECWAQATGVVAAVSSGSGVCVGLNVSVITPNYGQIYLSFSCINLTPDAVSKVPHHNALSSLTNVRNQTSQWQDDGKCLCCSSHMLMYTGFRSHLG